MIRTTKQEQIQFGEHPKFYREYAGLSTDTKPDNNDATGSLFLEVDTGDVYAYDEAGESWGKIASLGGGA